VLQHSVHASQNLRGRCPPRRYVSAEDRNTEEGKFLARRWGGRPASRNSGDGSTKQRTQELDLSSGECRSGVLDGAQDCVGAGEGPRGSDEAEVIHEGAIVLDAVRRAFPEEHAVVVLGAEVGHVISANPLHAFAGEGGGIRGEFEREGLGGLARISELEDAGHEALRSVGEGNLLVDGNVVLHTNADAPLRLAEQGGDLVVAVGVQRLGEDGGDILVLGVDAQQDVLHGGFAYSGRSINQI